MNTTLKHFAFFLLALLIPYAGNAFRPVDSAGSPYKLFATVEVGQGSLVERQDFVMRDYYVSLDVMVGWQTDDHDRDPFDVSYRYPKYGVGYYMGNMNGIVLGSDTMFASLGKPAALYAFFSAPMYRGKRLVASYGISAGMSYIFNAYDPEHNPFNLLIGSRNNAYLGLSVDVSFLLPGRSALATGVSFQHFSNGSYRKPNKGVNLISGTLAYQWSAYKNRDKSYLPIARPEWTPSFEWSMFLGSGVRMLDTGFDKQNPRENKRWWCLTLSTVAYRQVNFRRKWGAGVDVYYYEWGDYVKNYRAANDEIKPHSKFSSNNFTIGIYAAHEVGYKRLWMVTDLGFYPLPRVGDSPSSLFIYERVGLRVELTDRLFVGVAIKAHGAKADFTEWSTGYRIVRQS